MSAETYTYKGISAGKYIEGTIEAMSQDEASFKLKEQKIIITNLTRTKKKAAEKNPWGDGATTLEWTVPSPPNFHTFEELPKFVDDQETGKSHS